jgi:hypothetical protein
LDLTHFFCGTPIMRRLNSTTNFKITPNGMPALTAAVNSGRVRLSNPEALARVRESRRARRTNNKNTKNAENTKNTESSAKSSAKKATVTDNAAPEKTKTPTALAATTTTPPLKQPEKEKETGAAVVRVQGTTAETPKPATAPKAAAPKQHDVRVPPAPKTTLAPPVSSPLPLPLPPQPLPPTAASASAAAAVNKNNDKDKENALLNKRIEANEKRLRGLAEENKELRKELKTLHKVSSEIESTQILFTRQFEKAVSLLLAHAVDRVSLERLSAVVAAKIAGTRRV